MTDVAMPAARTTAHSFTEVAAPPSTPFNSAFSRRTFFAGLAAIGGGVLWSSLGTGQAAADPQGSLQVGRGMADMTGEPWGAGMNGYAVLEQSSIGLQRSMPALSFSWTRNQDSAWCTARLISV